MNMQTRNQYLETLVVNHGYKFKTKKEKTALLDEYCRNTNLRRKYVIRKIKEGKFWRSEWKRQVRKRVRKQYYDAEVLSPLIKIWEIFDYPCGQRLKSSLLTETGNLRKWKEITCSDEVAAKLQTISSRTIDAKLKREKEVRLLKKKYKKSANPLFYQKIPVKMFNEQDRTIPGNIQIDLVEHCGSSAAGEYLYTLSTTDLNTGWWEGEAIKNKSQKATKEGLDRTRNRYPFAWREIHSDNGTEFINNHLYRYTQENGLAFSRSRPYRKNDNFAVEQKNWTQIKKFIGYLRYDTQEELDQLNNLYRHELRLYKNFFQPVIKLAEKQRIKSKVKRKYLPAKTPYRYVLKPGEFSGKTRRQLTKRYQSLNPAELKRTIDKKLECLAKIYQRKDCKKEAPVVDESRKLTPFSVTFLPTKLEPVSVT